jgi:hypothetical protein
MRFICEDEGHDPNDEDKSVREYRFRDEESREAYSRWLCDVCAARLEPRGGVSNWADG